MKTNPIVLILCGGRSKRLWPLSQYKSKNSFDVFGFSPLRHTLKRFEKLTPRQNIFCVTGPGDEAEVREVKGLSKKNIFIEPAGRNTAPAILLSLLKLRQHKESSIIISPVDHLVKKEKLFYKSIRRAVSAAGKNAVCTLGIKPKAINSQFGYIQAGKKDGFAYWVDKFIEKPSPAAAGRLFKKKNCFYNSGIFIAKISFLLQEYSKYYPEYRIFSKSCASRRKLNSLYKRIGSIPFDKAIMEKTKNAKLVKAGFDWNDFGNWQAVYELLDKDKKANVKKGEVLIDSCEGSFIFIESRGKKVLAAGLKDIVFVDTPEYSLIAAKEAVKKIKPALKKFKLT